VGEPEFSVLFHQGKRDHIHISLVGERIILVVIFDDRTTIGMIRLHAKEASQRLLDILSVEETEDSNHVELGQEFTESADAKLDDIFQDD
jgi:hypothetical protein